MAEGGGDNSASSLTPATDLIHRELESGQNQKVKKEAGNH